MNDCIICEIICDRSEASFVHRDELVSAFMDIQPVTAGHVLVVPNGHASCLADLPEETGAQMHRVAQRTAAAIRESGLPCEGVNFFLADGEAAGQDVFHVHLHVFPRFPGDGFGLRLPDGYGERPARAELDAVADAIRGRLGPG